MNDTHSIERLLAESAWVRLLAGTLVRESADADDLAQDTLAIALERPPALDRPVRPWLATVARNLLRTRFRGEANRAARESDARSGGPGRAPEDLLQEVELQEELSALVRELDAAQRDAILLRYHEGLTAAEIGRQLGVPAATVRSRLKRGLAALREKLDARWDGDRRGWIAALTPLARPRRTAAGAAGSTGTLVAVSKVAAATTLAASIGYGAIYLSTPGSGGAQEDSARVAAVDPVRREAGAPPAARPVGSAALASPEQREAARSGDAGEASADAAPVVTEVTLRAVDPSGRPVAGATVEVAANMSALSAVQERIDGMSALERAAALASLRTTTDASGRARVWTDLLTTDVRAKLRLRGDGHAAAEVEVPVEPGDSIDAGDVVLRMRGRIFGTLRDRDGAPLEGEVHAYAVRDGEPELVATDSTSLEGGYSLFVDERGSYVLRGRSRYGPEFAEATAPVAIELGNEHEVRVEAERIDPTIRVRALDARGHTLRARVEYAFSRGGEAGVNGSRPTGLGGGCAIQHGGDASEVEVTVTPMTGLHAPQTVVRSAPFEDIELTFEAVERTERTLRLRAADGSEVTGSVQTRSFGQYDRVVLEGATATLEVALDPASEFGVTIQADGLVHRSLGREELLALSESDVIELTPLPGVAGLVTAGGAPLDRARLRISHVADPGEWWRSMNGVSGVRWGAGHDGRTDREGLFRIPLAWEGHWMLEASAPGWAPALIDLGSYDPAAGAAALELDLVRPGRVQGTVRDAAGEPRAKALVVALHPLHKPVRARSDREGAYALDLAPGDWTVLAPATEETERGTSIGLHVPDGWALPGGVRVASGATVQLDVAPPRTSPRALPVVLDGAPARGRVTFELVDGDPLLELERQRVELDASGRAALAVPTGRRCSMTARLDGVDGWLDRTADGSALLEEPAWELSSARATFRGRAGASVGLRVRSESGTLRARAKIGPEGVSEELTLLVGEVDAYVDDEWVPLGRTGAQPTELRLP
ncbi:MAG: sigma-70 family RNA polymerase sigma factor [Planctomycetota bacterium]